jgi:hypothetical protein
MPATKSATHRATHTVRRSASILSFTSFMAIGVALLAVGGALAGCEDKAIGRVCALEAMGAPNQAIVNGQALECPSRICLRPAAMSAATIDTTSLCSAECSKDSDCDGGEVRGGKPSDVRCKSGFVCGVAAVTGSFCCKKLCMCKDFLDIPPSGLQTPAACDKSQNPAACPLAR